LPSVSLCVACHLRVDETARQIWFVSGGTHRGKDPYFASFYRINFDGTGLVELTTTDANHNGSYSTDGQLFVDNYSRVDLAPVLELRKTTDNSIVATVERGDSTELAKTGWQPPEVFTAKGRDGKTDIWGVIIRPANFDPSKKYPVIENTRRNLRWLGRRSKRAGRTALSSGVLQSRGLVCGLSRQPHGQNLVE
jgi:dipeptidyl aminopeptidase/acylaminoacyl peptidase